MNFDFYNVMDRVFCGGSNDCEFLCSCVFVTSDGDMECLSEYMVVCWGDDAWQLGHLLLLSHFRSSVFTSLCFDCHLLF